MYQLNLTQLQDFSKQIAEEIPYLKMLVLFGSRARSNPHAKSDWDFAVLYDEELRQQLMQGLDHLENYRILAEVLKIPDDKIDIVDLKHCSHLLAFYVTKEGKLIYEREQGEFVRFQMKAWKLYADTAKFREWERKNIDLWLQKWGV